MDTISPKELLEKLENGPVHILDVRSKDKFDIGKLKHEQAQHINIFKQEIFDLEDGDEKELDLPKDEKIYVTCTTGNSAKKCTKILKEHGYDVTVLDGG